MFNSGILDVAVGILFVFILVSTLSSAIREGIEAWLKTRASYLEYAIRELLHDRAGTGLAKNFFNHPLIYSLYQGEYTTPRPSKKPRVWNRGRQLPSYIPSNSFALTLIDMVVRGPSNDAANSQPDHAEISFDVLRASVGKLPNPAVQRALLAAIDSANGDLDRARANIETWYDSAMERVSGWYKRSTQWIIFVIALGVVGGLNVNTITIAEYLYRDVTLRSALVAAASHTQALSYADASTNLAALHLPIGWSGGWGAPKSDGEKALEDPDHKHGFELWNDVIAPILGLLITAFAATLGAPFWFDVLNKVMTIRGAVKPNEKSSSAASSAPPNPNPTPSVLVASAPRVVIETENDVDGCNVAIDNATPDEDLPAAKGAVA